VTIIFSLPGLSYSSEDKVAGEVKDGYRILNVEKAQDNQKFTVFRGDYIKFKLPKEFSEAVAYFPTLKEKKRITHDLKTSPYFKMKTIGIQPFEINSIRGQISVIEYEQSSYKALSSEDADEYIKTYNPFILDVRTRGEYALGHLENAALIPVQELQRRIIELDIYKNNTILIYCASGNRSTIASKILIDSGFNKILNLRHGIKDWANKKYPIVR